MKGIIIFFVAVFLYAPLRGQLPGNDNTSKIRWGVKLGLAISEVQFDDKSGSYNPSINTRTGLIVGGYSRIKINDQMVFQPEIRFVGKGWKETGYYSYNATYLEFPLNIMYAPSNSKGTFFIGAGPAPAVYIGESLFYAGYTDFKGFDIGINALMGYEVALGFSLSLHYTHGLVNVNTYDRGNISVKNRSFGLTAGYTF